MSADQNASGWSFPASQTLSHSRTAASELPATEENTL
jgi:hypothetical protein